MKVCVRCILNETIPSVTFDLEGVCNYCRIMENMEKQYPDGEEGRKIFSKIVEEIKKAGKGKKYDCVIGVSGGCDSSYLVYIAKQYGLRPLAVHFDNTWNSSIAADNIKRVLKKMDVDLFTYVIDNEEFNDMARSFLEASVPEIDAITDVALTTVSYMAAAKYKIKYILDGHNFRTEAMSPLGWFYFDGKYVADIHKKFGTIPMKTYPNLWLHKWMKWLLIDRPKRIRPLYYIDFDKEKVKKFLQDEFGWQWYHGHHMENKYTLFCINYIMPVKFHIDLRYIEFSALIRSGQMTREQALNDIKTPPFYDNEIIDEVKKRLKISEKDFARILAKPLKTAKDYKTYHNTFIRLKPLFWLMLKADLIPKSFYLKYTK